MAVITAPPPASTHARGRATAPRPVVRQRQDGAGPARRGRPRLDAAAAHGLNDHLYDFLYAWHVPAFVFVTGYLSRSFTWAPRRMWQLVRTVAGALRPLRVRAGAVPHLRRRRAARGPVPRPALADVVPLGAVLLAAAHPGLHQAAHRGRDRGGGRDQPGRRALRRRHPRPGPGARPAAVLRARPDRDPGAARAAARAVGPQRRRCCVFLAIAVAHDLDRHAGADRVALLPLPVRRARRRATAARS